MVITKLGPFGSAKNTLSAKQVTLMNSQQFKLPLRLNETGQLSRISCRNIAPCNKSGIGIVELGIGSESSNRVQQTVDDMSNNTSQQAPKCPFCKGDCTCKASGNCRCGPSCGCSSCSKVPKEPMNKADSSDQTCTKCSEGCFCGPGCACGPSCSCRKVYTTCITLPSPTFPFW